MTHYVLRITNITMYTLLPLIPILPLLGFLILTLAGTRLPKRVVAVIGAGTVGLSAALALAIGATFLLSPPAGNAYSQTLWVWLQAGDFAPGITFRLDALSLVMIVVVTFVAFLIHLYSTCYMAEDEGYRRFFAYMNLFVSSMLILVLADNLLLFYLGWEGVGLSSYLLIGFWYRDRANVHAAMKAFIVTRVGDTAIAIALFILVTQLGTLQMQDVMQRAAVQWAPGSILAVTTAALLLAGAVGKSAQLPLQTWLPDAMAGPTPVSALLHAATMVTAGVYLIARMHGLFTLAPTVMLAVAIIGAVTQLVASFSALAQWDLKRILAYSTMSQIGYMFLALGVGAWSAAIFHFFTHAFFKALLFLGSGMVIMHMHEEHSIYKMGGLRRALPLTFWTFLIGACSLSALPLVTAGFYSKDMILYESWSSVQGNPWLWLAGWVGALLTSLYTFRMVFLVFFGPKQVSLKQKRDWPLQVPLVVLAVLAVIAGFINLPFTSSHQPFFTTFLSSVLPASVERAGGGNELMLQGASIIASLGGLLLAYQFFLRNFAATRRFTDSPFGAMLDRLWLAGWGFDWLYDSLLVKPFLWFTHVNRDDFFDQIYHGISKGTVALNRAASSLQTGNVRWYASGIAAGTVVILALLFWL